MKTAMARSPLESSSSSSKRHFQWMLGKGAEDKRREESKVAAEETLAFSVDGAGGLVEAEALRPPQPPPPARPVARRKNPSSAAAVALSRFRAAVTAAIAGKHRPPGFGPRVTGTLFGHRRGHVHVAFQVDPRACPALLIELATPTSALVREMASGLVRIALACERRDRGGAAGGKKLTEEPLWRAYCNGRKCGYAVRRECGPAEWRVLRAVEPVSTGAGVLPGGDCGARGEVMYMRARFERVVGSRDSEAFYMMNPDSNGGPELSIYLLRL